MGEKDNLPEKELLLKLIKLKKYMIEKREKKRKYSAIEFQQTTKLEK